MSEMKETRNAHETVETSEGRNPAKRRKRNRLVIIGAAVAIVAGAGAGMFVWHEQPSFCNAFCHHSMDAYVETYSYAAGSAGADKYGNQVDNSSAMMVVSHKDHNLACLDCHVPAITQQIGEVIETVSGDYTVVPRAASSGTALHEVGTVELMENSGHGSDGDGFCLRSGCHDLTRDDLTEKTADMEFNPHRWSHSEFECSDCHKSHRASVLYCTRCHTEAEASLPEGWIAYDTNEQIMEIPID